MVVSKQPVKTKKMNYKEAQQKVKEHFGLTGTYSKISSFPFYIKWLLIVPKDADFETMVKVLKSTLENNHDNEKGLLINGVLNKELEVYIIGDDGRFQSEISLEDYLYKSANAS